MPDLNNKSTYFILIIIHILIGIAGNYAPGIPGYFYLAVTVFFIYDIKYQKLILHGKPESISA
jgi:uncharacterized protein YqgC (DUF456 family)